MRATQLIGKTCLRTKPILKKRIVNVGSFLSMGEARVEEMPDYSYCTDPIKIINATDHHIVGEIKAALLGGRHRVILDERFCDDNWTDYGELVGEDEEDTDKDDTGEEAGEPI